MNKEEIEQAKGHLEWLLDNGILASEDEPHIENILKYIQHLEQKTETLDKVTDKLEEDAREEEGYIKWLDERTKEIVQPRKTIVIKSDYARSILNIIEGDDV